MAAGGHHRGRASSWLAVIIMLAGFSVGGVGLIVGLWWMFWLGIAIVVVGGIMALVVDVFSDVTLDPINPGDVEPFGGKTPGEITSSPATEETSGSTQPSASSARVQADTGGS